MKFKERAEQFKEDQKPFCKTNGCGKKLTPMEYLYSDYCFACNVKINEMKKAQQTLFDSAKFVAVLFKWNNQTCVWEKQRTFDVSNDKVKDIDGDIVTTLNNYYRYDIFLENAVYKTIYSYSPTKFD